MLLEFLIILSPLSYKEYININNNNMSYKYIIHLADIHIRTGNKEASRYEEYLEVFKNLELSIKKN